MIRKLINNKINDLCDIYLSSSNNLSVLRELENELKHRKTPKAKHLLCEVEKSINTLLTSNNDNLDDVLNNQIYHQKELFDDGNLKINRNPDCDSKNHNSISTIDKSRVIRDLPYDYNNFRGVGNLKDVPRKREFFLKNDLCFDFDKADNNIKKFRVALEALIKEIRSQNNGVQKFQVYNGKEISLPEVINGYSFSFDGEMDIFEGLNITTLIDNVHIEGKIYALYDKKIILSFAKPLHYSGLKSCTLIIDKAAFVEILKERYLEIENNKSKFHFNVGLADDMLDNLSPEISIDNNDMTVTSEYHLNQAQKNAVLTGLSNRVTYMWGPPGTGKTETITALIDNYYRKGKRVLLISNTNQAVDQVLLKMCDKVSNSPGGELVLNSGKFVRMGKIKKEELETKYGEFLNIESIIEKKSKEIMIKKQELLSDLNSILSEISINESLIKNFETIVDLINKKEEIDNLLIKLSNKLNRLNITLEHDANKISELEQERSKVMNAGSLKRIFLRNIDIINSEIKTKYEEMTTNKNQINLFDSEIADHIAKNAFINDKLNILLKQVSGIKESEVRNKHILLTNKVNEIKNEVNEIDKKLIKMKEEILHETSLIGSTITRVFLSPDMYTNFDCVIADEASMILLPALYYVAGLIKESVFISGDSRQLSPIIQTNQKAIFDLIGRDILTRIIEEKSMNKRVVKLDIQYRMSNKICSLVSINYPSLKTGKPEPDFKCKSGELNHSLIIINTSELYPYVNKDRFKSRYNIINVVIGQAIANLLEDNGESNIGFCTPYAAQAKILDRVLNQEKFVSGTIHKYQGDDKDTMIIDIPDSIGEFSVGMFLEGSVFEPDKNYSLDAGTKLFNVGISRAKKRLIIICNLSYLDKKLPSNSYLRKTLHTMIYEGNVIDARGLFDIKKYDEELSRTLVKYNFEELEVATGIYSENSFMEGVLSDMRNAEESILIYSGFITNERISSYESIFRKKILDGVKIKCVTRPPKSNGSMTAEETSSALENLEKMGCIVETRSKIHEKMVTIDNKIVWIGSLNPLSYNGKTNELMMRFEDEKLAKQLQLFLSVLKRNDEDFDSMVNENPKCPKCNSRTTYAISKYGPFWGCEKCNWVKSVK